MQTYDFIESLNQKVMKHIDAEMEEVSPVDLGLDERAGYRLYVNDEAIVTDKVRDNVLQYYGGFEYIDKSLRKEVGDYVFYFIDEECVGYDEDSGRAFNDCRVGRCIDIFKSKKEEADAES